MLSMLGRVKGVVPELGENLARGLLRGAEQKTSEGTRRLHPVCRREFLIGRCQSESGRGATWMCRS
jgi:hypothetical protein